MADLTKWELQILREVNRKIPASPWGAGVGAALEHLTENGYLTSPLGRLTNKGKQYLKEHTNALPRQPSL